MYNNKKNQAKKQQEKKQFKHELLDDIDDLQEMSKKWLKHNKEENFENTENQSEFTEDLSSSQFQAETETEDENIKEDSQSVSQYQEHFQQEKDNLDQSSISDFRNREEDIESEIEFQSKPRNHMPQMIDEDTELFKVKLDHLINVFKTDAISEFMGMKKSMLEDQKQQVKYDTEKYLNMYEEKSAELANTKQMLADSMQENEILTQRYEKMAQLCGEAKNKFWLQKNIGTYFNHLKNYKKQKLEKKQKKKMAEYVFKKQTLKKVFNVFSENYQQEKQKKESEKTQNTHLQEIEELSEKYSKELETLRTRYLETQKLLDSANRDKVLLQENLKKAFMRGVCALNFEAMSILGNKEQNVDENNIQMQTQNLNNTINNMGQNLMAQMNLGNNNNSQMDQEISNQIQQQQQQMLYQQQNSFNSNNNSYDQQQQQSYINNNSSYQNQNDQYQYQNDNSGQKTQIIYQDRKIESKDHLWREAPVVGVKKENINKENINSNNQQQYQSSLPDFIGNKNQKLPIKNQVSSLQQQDEDDYDQNNDLENGGRVVRINKQQQQNKSVSFQQQQQSYNQNKGKQNGSVRKTQQF